MKFIRWIFSGEVLLSGFLVGYLLTPITGGLIVFSHLFMAVSFVAFIYRLYKKKRLIKRNNIIIPSILYLAILGLMFLSLLYTPNANFGQEKVVLFSSLTAWTFFGTLFLIEDKDGLKRLFQGIIFYSTLTSFFMIVTFIGASGERLGIGGADNVIGVARISGLGIIMVVGLYFYRKVNRYKRFLAFILMVLMVVSLLGTASRGPLLALVFSLLFFVPLSFRFSLKDLTLTYNKSIATLFFLFGVTALILPFFIKQGYFDLMLERMNVLAVHGESAVGGRTSRFDTAMQMFLDSPILGQGIGSFSNFYWGIDADGYAHNIFLEFASELGFLGLFLFLVLLLYSLFVFVRHLRRNSLNPYQLVIFISVCYLLINANVSEDFNGNRLLFAFLALMAMTPKFANENVIRNKKELEQTANQLN